MPSAADRAALISTFGRLLEATHALERRLGDQLEASTGLPLTWFEVLLRLRRSPGQRLTMGELSQQLTLTSGGVTRLVDRMVEAGLVERSAAEHDRRVQHAVITAAGRAALSPATRVHAAGLTEVFAGFSPTDLDRLDALLDRLRDLG